ncbi:unnamed protein product [Polarella glacialis]|uniref:Uncharacterized protein n=1 Tax=Polarella glacialis TaxID=89957 RepID=A0A813K2S0_POLGL|nr:unnamed protein product [Polarella glacialis]
MLANLLDPQPEGMGAPESHSSRPPFRHPADKIQLPGSVEAPEDFTTPGVFEAVGFHLEQVRNDSPTYRWHPRSDSASTLVSLQDSIDSEPGSPTKSFVLRRGASSTLSPGRSE